MRVGGTYSETRAMTESTERSHHRSVHHRSASSSEPASRTVAAPVPTRLMTTRARAKPTSGEEDLMAAKEKVSEGPTAVPWHLHEDEGRELWCNVLKPKKSWRYFRPRRREDFGFIPPIRSAGADGKIVTRSDVLKHGEEGVHFVTGYAALFTMIQRYGKEHNPILYIPSVAESNADEEEKIPHSTRESTVAEVTTGGTSRHCNNANISNAIPSRVTNTFVIAQDQTDENSHEAKFETDNRAANANNAGSRAVDGNLELPPELVKPISSEDAAKGHFQELDTPVSDTVFESTRALWTQAAISSLRPPICAMGCPSSDNATGVSCHVAAGTTSAAALPSIQVAPIAPVNGLERQSICLFTLTGLMSPLASRKQAVEAQTWNERLRRAERKLGVECKQEMSIEDRLEHLERKQWSEPKVYLPMDERFCLLEGCLWPHLDGTSFCKEWWERQGETSDP